MARTKTLRPADFAVMTTAVLLNVRHDLERCAAVCGTLRARLPAGDRALVLVGQLEALAGDPDPSWSTVIAVAATLGDLDAALRPQET